MNKVKVISWRNCNVMTKKGDKLFIDGFGYAKSGEILAVMGPSGSGKSTFFNLITGNLDEEQTGTMEVRMNGEVISDITKTFSYYSYKHQSCLYYHYLTAYETLEQIGCLYIPDAKERKKRINDLLQSLDLVQAKNSYAENLSSGQKERLFIAISIMNPTDILMLDEPFSKVDTQIFLDLIRLIMAEKMKGRIVIFSIHVITPEIEEYIDNLMLISEGRVVYFGYYSNVIEYFNNLPLGLNVRSIDEVISAVFVRNEFGVSNTDDVLRNRKLNVMAIENYSEPYLELYEDFSVKPSRRFFINLLWYYHTLDALRACFHIFLGNKFFLIAALVYFLLNFCHVFLVLFAKCCSSDQNCFKEAYEFFDPYKENLLELIKTSYPSLILIDLFKTNPLQKVNPQDTDASLKKMSFQLTLLFLYFFTSFTIIIDSFLNIVFNRRTYSIFYDMLELNYKRKIYTRMDIFFITIISSFLFQLIFSTFFRFPLFFTFLKGDSGILYCYLKFSLSILLHTPSAICSDFATKNMFIFNFFRLSNFMKSICSVLFTILFKILQVFIFSILNCIYRYFKLYAYGDDDKKESYCMNYLILDYYLRYMYSDFLKFDWYERIGFYLSFSLFTLFNSIVVYSFIYLS